MHPCPPMQCLHNGHAPFPLWNCCEHSGSQATHTRPLEPIVSPEERRLSIAQSRDSGRPENVYHRPLISIRQCPLGPFLINLAEQATELEAQPLSVGDQPLPVHQDRAICRQPPRQPCIAPPETEVAPHQMNALRSLSMHSIGHEDRGTSHSTCGLEWPTKCS
jgi:hypothetical protein